MSDPAAPDTKPTPRRHRLIDWIPEGARLDADSILDRFLRWVAGSGIQPYPAQEEALLELMTGRHVVLSTPTGSGKSLVALGLHFKALCEGRRSIYTAPIKALVSEKFFALCDEFGAENVGMLTGDASINWGAPVICCTAEVLANMALRQGDASDAPYVVMDEFHYYADRDRGWAWQVPLLVLRRTRFLLMSATLGNTAPIEERIEAFTGNPVSHVHADERPVPLEFEYRETPFLETVESLLAKDRAPIYIVHFTQREAAEQAQGLTSGRITDKDEKRAIAEAIGEFRFDTPYGKDFGRILRFGIGIHHAGLLPKYRLLVEQLAQRGLLKVICGTDTLGVGVNVPIRSVLFSKLSKFDGEKVGVLSVRDFKQIAGRAGRKGFDDHGFVVCQAPEHVIENKKLASKEGDGKKGKKKAVRKQPPPGFVGWSKETFLGLAEKPPEMLVSRMRITPGMLVSLLQRGADEGSPGSGYDLLADLVAHCHEDDKRRRRLMREAANLFRSLRRAGIVEVESERSGGSARVSADLQTDFGLHHTLSLYLVDAVAALDPESPDYALDVISCVEAILENPRPILQAQQRREKGELIASLKAEGVPYEERMEKLEDVSWPKPAAEFIYATFNLFAERHPWVGAENIRPKSIAREIWERFDSFEDYVKRLGLQRSEGLLLRYLSQVHSTLGRNLPERARNEEIDDVLGFLRAMLARVDSSLIEEWEQLVHPEAAPRPDEKAAPRPPRRLDTRALEAQVRAELHQLVRALSRKDYTEAVACVRGDGDERWDEARFEAALAPYFEDYESILFDPEARRNHWTLIRPRGEGVWEVFQTLLDPEREGVWRLEGEVAFEGTQIPPGPLVELIRIAS